MVKRYTRKRGGAAQEEDSKAQVLSELSSVENRILAGRIDGLINTPEDRRRFVEGLLAQNKIEEASDYVRRLDSLVLHGGRKRTYRRKQTRKNKKHGKKV